MKKTLLGLTFLAAGTLGVLAQGQVLFSNEPANWTDGIDRLVYQAPGVPVKSDAWKAELQELRGSTWTPLGAKSAFYGDFGGSYPDYAGWWPDDGTKRIVSVAPLATTQLRVAIYGANDALLATSPQFAFTQAVSDPPAPADFLMTNFRAFTVPEPSTLALGVLGLGSLLLFRRRK